MLFLTFLFPYHVVNSQKYIIITLTNARAIHSHSPLLLPVKPMTSRLIARFPNIRMIAVRLVPGLSPRFKVDRVYSINLAPVLVHQNHKKTGRLQIFTRACVYNWAEPLVQ